MRGCCRRLEQPVRRHPPNSDQGLPSKCCTVAGLGVRHAVCSPSQVHTHMLLSDFVFHSLNPGMLKAQQLVNCHLCWSPGVVVQFLIHDPDGDALVGRLHSFPTPCRAYHKAERENLDR